MENAAKKTMPLWRKLILLIPLGVIAFCWIFLFAAWFAIFKMDVPYEQFGEELFQMCGFLLIAGSAALILALIPIIFFRPLSGSEEIQVLRALGRCLLFFAAAVPAISFQCFVGLMCFWGPVA